MNSARSAKKKGSNINGTAGPSACPGESLPPDLIRGWTPVRRKGHAPTNESRACPDSAGTGHALAFGRVALAPRVRCRRPCLRGGARDRIHPIAREDVFQVDRIFSAPVRMLVAPPRAVRLPSKPERVFPRHAQP